MPVVHEHEDHPARGAARLGAAALDGQADAGPEKSEAHKVRPVQRVAPTNEIGLASAADDALGWAASPVNAVTDLNDAFERHQKRVDGVARGRRAYRL